jgi:hypothetical protein
MFRVVAAGPDLLARSRLAAAPNPAASGNEPTPEVTVPAT